MKIYFVRHGESQANILRVVSNRGSRHGLTTRGQQQAALLAARLADRPLAAVFSSPLLRAVETAARIAAPHGLPVQISDALREYDCGVLEGLSDEATWVAHAAIAQAWVQERDWERKPADGESFLDIRARFIPFIEQLVATSGDTEQELVLVGHGGLYRLMLPQIFQNLDHDFAEQHPIPNTAYILGVAERRGLVCAEWCGMRVPRS